VLERGLALAPVLERGLGLAPVLERGLGLERVWVLALGLVQELEQRSQQPSSLPLPPRRMLA